MKSLSIATALLLCTTHPSLGTQLSCEQVLQSTQIPLFLLPTVEILNSQIIVKIGGPSDLSQFPELRSIYGPLAKMPTDRGLQVWNKLSSKEQNQTLEAVAQENLKYSRTATFGKSNKGFVQEAESVKEQVKKNAIDLLNIIKIAADTPLESSVQLRTHIDSFNKQITHGLNAVRSTDQAIGQPGEVRTFTIGREKAAGMSVESLAQRFDEYIEDLFAELKSLEKNPEPEMVIALAAKASLSFDKSLKPYFDGNGRTMRAIADYILLRFKLPTATLIGDAAYELGGHKHAESWHGIALKKLDLWQEYLNEGVKETIRMATKSQKIDPTAVATSLDISASEMGMMLGQGMHGTTYLHKMKNGQKVVLKVAKAQPSLAQNRREVQIMLLTEQLAPEVSKHFPKFIDMDPTGLWIRKQYIKGSTGEEMLNSGAKLSKIQLSELKKIFDISNEITRKYSIVLDLKPKNIVWNKTQQAWIFIDLGPKYLPINESTSFNFYLNTYWNS